MTELSDTATRAAYRESSDEAWIVLLTIQHEDLSVPGDVIRVASSGTAVDEDGNEYVESNGERFYAFDFEFELPTDQDGETPKAKLRIANAGKVRVPDGEGGLVEVNLLQELRRITGEPTLTCHVVLADAPDAIEYEIADLTLRRAEADAVMIEGELAWEDALEQECPTIEYTPATAPGLFP